MKQLLTTNELIFHMKEKGIRFNIINEEEAKAFLENNNYYMKLASYRTNYPKCDENSSRAGKYECLEFAYLKELSTLDMHLRYIIAKMCLDIEHSIKVRFLKDISTQTDDDGYAFLKRYFSTEDHELSMLKRIKAHKSGEYCKDLIEKYYPYFPIYALLEVISFGDLIHLVSFYEKDQGKRLIPDNKFMNTVRDLRNASAHSNCIMNKIHHKLSNTQQPDSTITNFVKNISTISKTTRSKQLRQKFSYNLTTLLFVYDKMVNEASKIHRYAEIQDFLKQRCLRNREYFKTNTRICAVYEYFNKLIDNLEQNSKIST